jgi:undecaprenyl-diphosphatase
MTFVEAVDIKILIFIIENVRNPILDNLLYFLTTIGNKGIIWIIISVIMLIKRRTRKVGITILLALLLGLIFGEIILKPTVGRLRPFLKYAGFESVISNLSSYSFPSGHTTSSFAAAAVIYIKKIKYRMVYIILALLIAFSRIYFTVHYPSDIVGGIILGLICAYLATQFERKVYNNKNI